VKYREFVQTLSEDALVKERKQLRWLSGDGKIVETTPSVFRQQLEICREDIEGGTREQGNRLSDRILEIVRSRFPTRSIANVLNSGGHEVSCSTRTAC